MEKAHAFPTLVAAAQAVPYSVLLSDYTELHLPVDGLSFLQVQNQQEVMDFNAKLIGGFETIINDVDFIRTNLDQFRNPDGSPVDDKTLAQVRVNCLQQIDQIRLQMSRCSKDALSCARSLVAPEDFARDLPKIGAPDGKILVPNLVGVDLQRFKLGSLGLGHVPIEAKPVVLDDEFGLLHFVVSIAASDTVPAIPFTPLSSLEVIEQDPPGGGLVESGSSVSLKIKAHNPF